MPLQLIDMRLQIFALVAYAASGAEQREIKGQPVRQRRCIAGISRHNVVVIVAFREDFIIGLSRLTHNEDNTFADYSGGTD